MPSTSLTSSQGDGGRSGGWVELTSQSINSVAFDRQKNTLKVKFNKGDVWEYANVPLQKYKTLVYSSSSGAYLRKEIIPHHPGAKIDDGNSAEP